MFDDITFTTYGRTLIGKNWHVSSNIGSNRLYYIHSGEIFYCGNGMHKKLKRGHLYLFPQNLSFELEFDADTVNDHTYFDFITVPPIRLDDIIELDLSEKPVIAAAADILLRLGEAYPISSKKSTEYKKLIKSYLNNLLTLINKETKIQTIDNERINSVIKYIHENIYKELTVEELAAVSCTEKNYFIKLFKKNMLVTPYKYIKNYRLTLAASLLKRGISVTEAAAKVGYSDSAAFSNAFKDTYGISPSEFLKQKEFYI